MSILLYIIAGLIFAAPYKYLGQDNVNVLLFFIISSFSVFFLKEVKGNKRYSIFILIMTIISIESLSLTSFTIDSMQGVSLYIATFLLYFIFCYYREKEKRILKVLTYVLLADCVFYIILQGAILNGGILKNRIDGNIGYANTYALLMLIGLYFNSIREKDSLKEIIDILFIEGILFTGSRNTLLYLAVFILVDTINIKRTKGFWCFSSILNCFLSEASYLIVGKFKIIGVIILPIIFIIYYCFFDEKYYKIINIVTLVSIPVGIAALFITDSNFYQRVAAISLNSNELQLRIGYAEDAINHIIKNPLGCGLNTYMYDQGSFQTGYYDIRYVHNAFVQALYDMGIIGFVSFTALFFIGIVSILSGKNKNKYYYLSMYMTIYLHSFLDFNFAYLCIPAAAVMCVAFAGEINFNLKRRIRIVNISIFLASFYIATISMTYYIGEKEYKKGYFIRAIHIAEKVDAFTIGDNACKELQFKGYRSLYRDTGDIRYLETGINIIESVCGTKNRKSYIYTDLSSAYEEFGNVEKSSYYYEKNLEIQKYCPYIYTQYCNMLSNAQARNGINYDEKRNEIMDRYQNVVKSRTEKSIKRFG